MVFKVSHCRETSRRVSTRLSGSGEESRSICRSSIRGTNDHWQTFGSAGSVPCLANPRGAAQPQPCKNDRCARSLSCVISLRRRNLNDAKQTSPHHCCVLLAEPSRRTRFHHLCSSPWHKARPTTMRPVHLAATGSCRGEADG